MSSYNAPLLVCTALENTWGDDEHILFLGEWCKLYERRDVWEKRNYAIVPFHWDNRLKLAQDYDYLQSFHHLLLDNLAISLNTIHQVNYSTRYWQIILDPWLLTYVSVIFDRWAHLKFVFENNEQVNVVFLKDNAIANPALSYVEFITQVLSDEWNQLLCERIINSEYCNQCVVHRVSSETNEQVILIPDEEKGWLSRVDQFLGRCFSKSDVMFFMSNFNLSSLVRLNSGFLQVPRLYSEEFRVTGREEFLSTKVDTDLRKRFHLGFEPQSAFEAFVKKNIANDLPLSIIEGYKAIGARMDKVTLKPKIIVTASAHWTNVMAKFWFAEQVNRGVKLVILEHGGSFPAHKELFDFEEDIADVRGTWFLPYHEKHEQVPPSKLANRYAKPRGFIKKHHSGKYCSIIGNECSRWVYRCQFYPQGLQCLTSFEWVCKFYEKLDPMIQQWFKVKPYPNQGINTKQRYEDRLGHHRVFSESNIDKVFKQSKVVVCTYPETTFSEAMASGVPTIMLYPSDLYERHTVAWPLLDMLREANIVFHDYESAATHLNAVWHRVTDWWSSPSVRNARVKFDSMALSLNDDWRSRWRIFINDQLKVSIV